MMKVALEAPWQTYGKKIKALFEFDPEITVGDIESFEDDEISYVFTIEVSNHEKFVALDRVLPDVVEFGNVKLGIHLIDTEKADVNPGKELYEIIFKGNPIVKDIKERIDHTGMHWAYVCFQPDVIQFFDDDLTDYNGNWSGLAQDIAREVFADSWGVNFCTADKRENA